MLPRASPDTDRERLPAQESERGEGVKHKLKQMLPSYIGAIEQRYPMYSSAKVKGKPLYWWARQGRLDEIEIPTHMVKIDAIELISLGSISHKSLEEYIVKTVGSVQGDFRQKEIIKQWKDTLGISIPSLRPCPQCSRISEAGGETNDNMKPRGAGSTLLYSDKVGNSIGTISLSCGIAASSQYFAPPRNDKNSELQTFNPRLFDGQDTDLNALFTLRISCGSGTYMRQLVMDIGEKINIPICAFKIKRTRVGEYRIGDCVS
jgi:tRNA pseudouridine55 synthase